MVSVWDLAALKVIVEEAGGRFTDLAGVDTIAGGTGIASNGLVHDAALALVGTRAPARHPLLRARRPVRSAAADAAVRNTAVIATAAVACDRMGAPAGADPILHHGALVRG